jgi:hypothetical protein
MANEETTRQATRQTLRSDAESLQEAQAEQAGPQFEWHYGRVTRIGNFGEIAGREVTIIWEEGGVTSQQGDISDAQWEILKLAFLTTKRIAILSDSAGDNWMYDYRFLEAVG